MRAWQRTIAKIRSIYRAHLADHVDFFLARKDTAEFSKIWNEVSPVLSWDHRPTARRLWELAKLPGDGTIVEIGSYLGNGSIYLAKSGGEMHAVDPHSGDSMTQVEVSGFADDISAQFLNNLKRFGVSDRVIYHRLPSVEAAHAWTGQRIKLLFIDGLHTYDAVIADYTAWREFLGREHVVLFDDFLWRDVEKAVRELRIRFRPPYFYVRGGQAIFSTRPLSLRIAGFV